MADGSAGSGAPPVVAGHRRLCGRDPRASLRLQVASGPLADLRPRIPRGTRVHLGNLPRKGVSDPRWGSDLLSNVDVGILVESRLCLGRGPIAPGPAAGDLLPESVST